jgi:AcrR family transcriptional regulator
MGIKKTQISVVNALLELLKEKKYPEIKVSEICEQAKIGRVTYYRHFQSKDDVIKLLFVINQKEYLTRYYKPFDISTKQGCFDLVYAGVRFFYDKKDSFKVLFKSDALPIMVQAANSFFPSKFQTLPNVDEVMSFALTGAMLDIFAYWTYKDFSISPETMTENIMKFLTNAHVFAK